MNTIKNAVGNLNHRMTDRSRRPPLTFEQFVGEMQQRPTVVLRNVFEVMHDMVVGTLGAGVDEYPDDPESIHFVNYDCSRLFEIDTDRPFFADRLFANRLVKLVEGMKRGAQQNKIYIFFGPPGSGKSTFLNNLLRKFESYCNSDDGLRYEIVWRLDPAQFGPLVRHDGSALVEQLAALLGPEKGALAQHLGESMVATSPDGFLEIPCPSHDNPVLIIPKDYRPRFFEDLFGSDGFNEKLSTDREFLWVYKDKPCTFCSSLYQALLNKLKKPEAVHKMIGAQPYRFNRRLGEGITVYNPGDPEPSVRVLSNPALQMRLNALLKNSNEVRYLYSRHARTNNGIYALMDIKSHNTDRLIELHNIISEGVHKVEDIEETVNSLLLAVMNPEDQKDISEFKSFSDRIEYITVPYVLDINTELKIYRHTFGTGIDERFLPGVLPHFARVMVSTRMNPRSEALREWIDYPQKYAPFCDANLQLLKMEIYRGLIPPWLSEEDRKNLTAKRRRGIIDESDTEGQSGISGRDSIKIFSEFLSICAKQDKLISMAMLCDYFTRIKSELNELIPAGFLDSLLNMYNYAVLQEVKESLYYYNEKQITSDILNYLFAVNFEPPTEVICTFTKEPLRITEDFFQIIEARLLGPGADTATRKSFRARIQHEYTSKALTQEMMVGQKGVMQTEVYKDLRTRYVQNLKQKALDPFLDNDNFRRAIKDFGGKDYNSYDKRIRDDVRNLFENLQKKFGYTEQGAREVCIYVIDSNLARAFSASGLVGNS